MIPIYRKLPQNHYFDYAFLMHVLQSYNKPRDRVTKMLHEGEIIRIRKGLYILSPDYGGQVHLYGIANAIYGPSYISLDSALSYYNLIPERVVENTSVTIKVNRFFYTPLGNFAYYHIKKKAFPAGVKLNENENGGYLIASKEKALCDKVWSAKNIRTIREIKEYLFDNLRIDPDELKQVNVSELTEIKNAYSSTRIDLLFRVLVD